jgi:hypothetical protein
VKRCKCEKGVTRFVLFEWTSLSWPRSVSVILLFVWQRVIFLHLCDYNQDEIMDDKERWIHLIEDDSRLKNREDCLSLPVLRTSLPLFQLQSHRFCFVDQWEEGGWRRRQVELVKSCCKRENREFRWGFLNQLLILVMITQYHSCISGMQSSWWWFR